MLASNEFYLSEISLVCLQIWKLFFLMGQEFEVAILFFSYLKNDFPLSSDCIGSI